MKPTSIIADVIAALSSTRFEKEGASGKGNKPLWISYQSGEQGMEEEDDMKEGMEGDSVVIMLLARV